MITLDLIAYTITRDVEQPDGSIISETVTVQQPERELTDDERKTITKTVYTGSQVIYYQNTD